MPDLDIGGDEQDSAETYDETNREDQLAAADGDDFENPDVAADVYDVTSALGDADDDNGVNYQMDAADFGPEDIDGDDIEDDEDDDDDLDDGFEDEPDDLDIDDDDDEIDASAGRAAPSEPGLSYVGDLDASTSPRDDEADKYESTRPLSDDQLNDLGYLNEAEDQSMTAKTLDGAKSRPSEDRSFKDGEASIKGTGATADDVKHGADAGDDDRLDEGLEETFPASDPVSAKHIT